MLPLFGKFDLMKKCLFLIIEIGCFFQYREITHTFEHFRNHISYKRLAVDFEENPEIQTYLVTSYKFKIFSTRVVQMMPSQVG